MQVESTRKLVRLNARRALPVNIQCHVHESANTQPLPVLLELTLTHKPLAVYVRLGKLPQSLVHRVRMTVLNVRPDTSKNMLGQQLALDAKLADTNPNLETLFVLLAQRARHHLFAAPPINPFVCHARQESFRMWMVLPSVRNVLLVNFNQELLRSLAGSVLLGLQPMAGEAGAKKVSVKSVKLILSPSKMAWERAVLASILTAASLLPRVVRAITEKVVFFATMGGTIMATNVKSALR